MSGCGRQARAYKVICISVYVEDLRELDAKVDRLRAKGMLNANRSSVIRHALQGLDVDQVLALKQATEDG